MSRWLVPALLWSLSCASMAGTEAAPPLEEGQKEAIFAGGCFWCMEKPFEVLPGVVSVTSGYTGGPEKSPSYQEVGHGQTKHREAIRVVYLEGTTDYAELLTAFWHNIDPTQANGQFCDHGSQYTTAIFTSDPAERRAAQASKEAIAKQLAAPVVTVIEPASTFWEAEAYHQDFYKTNPDHYQRYRAGCGRDARLKELWGDKAGH